MGIERTSFGVYGHTLLLLRHDWPDCLFDSLFFVFFIIQYNNFNNTSAIKFQFSYNYYLTNLQLLSHVLLLITVFSCYYFSLLLYLAYSGSMSTVVGSIPTRENGGTPTCNASGIPRKLGRGIVLTPGSQASSTYYATCGIQRES